MRRACALALAAVAAAGCGSNDKPTRAGALTWSDGPRLLVPEGVPDRILVGRVRNDSLRPLRIRASDVRVLDPSGRAVEASAVFTDAISKPLYPQDRGRTLPDFDRERLGLIVSLRPGQDAPLLVGWRQPAGADAPTTIDYRTGTLAIGRPPRITEDSPRRYPTGPAERP